MVMITVDDDDDSGSGFAGVGRIDGDDEIYTYSIWVTEYNVRW